MIKKKKIQNFLALFLKKLKNLLNFINIRDGINP